MLPEVAEESFRELWKTPKKICNFGKIKIPKEAPSDKGADVRRPGDKSRDPSVDWMGQKIQIMQERSGNILRDENNPQDQSRSLKIMSISDAAETPAQENIQGVGTHLR